MENSPPGIQTMPDEAAVGALREFEMVGPKVEPPDAVGESVPNVLALALETERDDDWNAAKTIATGMTTITRTMATLHQSVEDR